MEDYLSRDQIKIPKHDIPARIIGKELREEGYRLGYHVLGGGHVMTPSGEEFNETRMVARYRMVSPKEKVVIKKALQYLILCQEKLRHMGNLGFTLD